MRGVGGRRLIVLAAVAGVLIMGGGVAYALTPTAEEKAAALEQPDGTQPTTDEEALAAEIEASASLNPSPSATASASAQASAAASSSVAGATATATTTVTVTTSPTVEVKAAATSSCETGESQLQVEQYLSQIGTYGAIIVDGVQTDADCATIKAFQTRFGISPASGRAGPTTVSVAGRIATSLTSAEMAKCGAGSGLTACVDLTQQTMWVVKDGTIVFGPTVVRTGMSGYATPAGTYSVIRRSKSEWSEAYEVWLPYWQNFVRGIGFHATTTYIHNSSVGSHGCVNLLYNDAQTLYSTIGMGTTVKTFGRRSGT